MNFDEKVVDRIKKLEREVERLRVKESPDMSSYLGITAKAADSDKLDGLDSTDFGRPVFLTTRLASTSFDGDSFSSVGKTLIDLSAVYGIPANVKAIMAQVSVRDSGSAASQTAAFILAPDNGTYTGVYTYCAGLPNDVWTNHCFILPCNSNGDIYYKTQATGSLTMEVYFEIWGYWL